MLWIGGAQWAGKSTVTTLLAARYPVVTYRYDYHDARSHAARARRDPHRFPFFSEALRQLDVNPDLVWVDTDPAAMAETARAVFIERFEMVLEDLALLPAGATTVAEGWGLRPELLAPTLDAPEHAVFLVPTPEFRDRQLRELERAGRLATAGLSDPARAQRNRVERDEILARELIVAAAEHGLRVIHVDGSIDPTGIETIVEEQFRPFLPRWLY